MKKLTYYFATFVVIIFSSCSEIEPLDPALLNGGGSNSSGGGNGSSGGNGSGGGNSSGGGTTTADYWPTKIGNMWQFSLNGANQNPLEIVGTDVFSNQTYYRFSQQSGSGSSSSGTVTTWINKNNGNYTIKTDDIVVNANGLTGTQSGFEYIILKDNVPNGNTWNGSYTQTTNYSGFPPIVQTTNFNATIIAKDVTETVNNETYNNIIKVKIEQTSTIQGSPTNVMVETEYWYARNIGPVKVVNTSNGSTSTQILVNYTLN